MILRSHTQVFSTIFIKLIMSVDSTLGYRTPWTRPNWRVAPRSAIRWLDAKEIIHSWKQGIKNRLSTIIWRERDHGKSFWSEKSNPKAPLNQKKVMLLIMLDWKGFLYFEFLLPSRNINSNVYCQQLDNWEKIEKINPRIDQPEGRRLPSRQCTTSLNRTHKN